MESNDDQGMLLALKQAEKALRRGEVPIGAAVLFQGRILGRGYNKPIQTRDPTAHAEIVALRQAARRRGNYRLVGCDLYVTLEPCAMCLGAAVQARVRTIVYGASDPKNGAVSSLMSFPFDKMNHRPEIRAGVRGAECRRLLGDFFQAKRRRRKSE